MEGSGAAGVANALNAGFTADALWGALGPFIPVVITVTLVSFGFFIVRRIIKKFGKGKSGI